MSHTRTSSDDSDDALHRTVAGLLGRDAARRTLRLKMGVMREVGVIKRDVRSYDEASEQAKELLKEAAEQVGIPRQSSWGAGSRSYPY